MTTTATEKTEKVYTKADIVPRGKEIYERDIKPLVEPEHIGKYIVIDIETGEWDMDTDPDAATLRACAKKPVALRLCLRIGHRSAGIFRGGVPPR